MKHLNKALGTIAFATLALGYTNVANAATVTTSGTWSNPQGTAADVMNNGNTISWGNPANTSSDQSSYVFDGNGGVEVDDTTFQVFKLGTFTHDNFPITQGDFLGATLTLNLDIDGQVSQGFTFDFAHNETLNEIPCDPQGSTVCPDVVDIPSAIGEETISYNGKTFQLQILGFSDTIDGPKVTQFITEEGMSNQTMLFGQLKPEPVPEPLTILGSATALGFGGFLKRESSRKKNKTKQDV
jgi:hypothetical protein